MLTTAYAIGTKTAIFPSKGIHGTCIDCGEEVISKCGTIVSHHFAHKTDSNCGTQFHDHKSEWHQQWQHTIVPAIPGENVEVTIKNDTSIKRADMVSHANYVIEFQHSHLSLPERLEREDHYKNIIWVVHTDKITSKTWKKPKLGKRTRFKKSLSTLYHEYAWGHVDKKNRVFFNGDDDRILWDADTVRFWSDYYTIRCQMTKTDFIRRVINNPFYCESVFTKIEERQLKHHMLILEQEDKTRDEHYGDFVPGERIDHIGLSYSDVLDDSRRKRVMNYYNLKSKFYEAATHIISELVALEQYHEKIEIEKKLSKKREEAERIANEIRVEEEKIAKLLNKKREEAERIANEKRVEEEKIAKLLNKKREEAERIANEKRVEEEKIANEIRVEEEKIAKLLNEKREEAERIANEKQVEEWKNHLRTALLSKGYVEVIE